jgi:glycosyltransferase involved in cell wall biosynthesis
MSSKKGVDLSVVIPVFNEEESLPRLYLELDNVLKRLKTGYEIIFVDDGSVDGSTKILEKFHCFDDKRVKVVQFRKNFGKTPALMAGFELAQGGIIMTMDGDLQNDPLDIPKFLKKIGEGFDVVVGWRYRRKDPVSKLLPSKVGNWLFQIATKMEMHDFNCGFKAFRREVLRNVRLYGEMHRYIPIFLAAKGFKVTEIRIRHHERKFGKSKYGFIRMVKGFLDLLYVKFWLDFSTRPIHFLGGIGLLQYLLALVIFIEQVVKAYMIRYFSVGPLLALAVMLTTTGTLCILFGFLAEIQIRTYYENSKSKTYAIKKILK